MHRNVPVVQLEIDSETEFISKIGKVYNNERLPIGISIKDGVPNRKDLHEWWLGRCIPASRQNIKEALYALGVSTTERLIMRCFGLSLSDQYWVNPVKNPLDWGKINFFNNPFSEDVGNALFGGKPKDAFNLISPNNTSDGWLKKKWQIIDGKRVLIKGGSGVFQQEPYNEVIASAICRRLDMPHVSYTVKTEGENPYSLCDNFVTKETEFVPAWRIIAISKRKNHDSYFSHLLRCADSLGIPNVRSALHQMLVLDYIIMNEDRHYNNFGFIRDAATLKWVGAAPIFDNGTSIWYNTMRVGFAMESKPFRNSHEEQIKLLEDFSWLDLGKLNGAEEEFDAILKQSSFVDEARRNAICNALMERINKLALLIK